MKEPWKIDVNVLIIFFVRDEVLSKTFEAVKKARPRRLFLWQDGPREGREDDLAGIARCRKVVEDIDWDCEVYTAYNEKNFGCDPSIYYAYKWAFSKVDKCIFLEDDQVPNESYFRFCKELLDKYENDTRISHICGYNYTEIAPDCDADYLFAPFGSGAWATWKRVVDEWEGDYAFLQSPTEVAWVEERYGQLGKQSLKNAQRHKATGKEFWESIVGCNCMWNSHYAIIPKKNLVSNMGLTENSTHSNTSKRNISKATADLFEMQTYELEFPLKHPKHVLVNQSYIKRVYRIMGIGHPFVRFGRKISYGWKCIIHGDAGRLFKALGKRLKKKGK